MRTGIIRVTQIFVLIIFIISIFSNCEKPIRDRAAERFSTLPNFDSFRNIPGVTDDEIKAIEALREQRISFIYGTTPSTEAFRVENNEVNGFTALFCNWLTKIFGISFVPVIYTWGDLVNGLDTFEIDFTGELTATDERRKTYFMTDTIAERTIKYFRISHSMPLAEIAQLRPLRYIFLRGTTTVKAVLPALVPGTYEPIFIDDSSLAYDLLKSGEADAFINEGPGEASFDIYGDVVATDFFPLIYEPVSMTTKNPELKPVISVVEKILLSGGIRYLTMLYNQGYLDYTKHKFTMGLSDAERAYINDPLNKVAFVAEPDNYPLSFYNKQEKKWQGIAFDVITEIEKLTGLKIELVNDQYATFPVLLKMLEDGRASMISELIRTKEREGQFLWITTPLLSSGYALISKSDYPNVNLNEVFYEKVGLLKDTAHAALFKTWFPNHPYAVEYENAGMAINALARDEVNLVMARETRLLDLTNYHEMVGYRANIVFDEIIGSSFGINKNDEVICSIIDKALYLIDTNGIADQWMSKSYDYRTKVVEAQRPWFVGVAGLFLCVIVLIFILFMRNRQEGRRLERLVEIRTGELRQTLTQLKAVTQDLEVAAKTAEAASLSKSQFLANMSHEIRTPMNAILGITEILLRNESLASDIREPLGKIYNSGDLLLNIINDILDLSKIEAGKLELAPTKYEAASLINDTVTLNMMRIGSKPIEFKLSVDEKIPSTLFGDELRIKQILNNILSNAFKYTGAGEVKLSVSVGEGNEAIDFSEADVTLVFSVDDTGQGMTEEQVSKLFDEYSRFNMEANRTTEGTGLGMSITHNLINMMGGRISVKSEPEKGSVFTVCIPQKAIGYGTIGKELAENLQRFELDGGKQLRKAQIVYEPMPYGSVLVVDDVESNLYVAKGLMSPYGLLIDTAESGFEAIEKIKGGKIYDIVFMDHMMPKMDGIEATKKMRELKYNYPIVALTANAVIGQSDVFIQSGFDGFISKPIDMRQLNATLKKFVRDKQPPEVIEAARQQSAATPTGNTGIARPAVSARLAGFFVNDAVKAIATLEAIQEKGTYGEEDLQLYTISVHGMKSALANVGELELSAVASKLEMAGRNKEIATITAETPEFLNKLRGVIEKLKPKNEENEVAETTEGDNAELQEKLIAIKTACEAFDRKTVKSAIAELQQKTWPQPIKEMLTTMAERLLDGDFAAVANVAEKILETK